MNRISISLFASIGGAYSLYAMALAIDRTNLEATGILVLVSLIVLISLAMTAMLRGIELENFEQSAMLNKYFWRLIIPALALFLPIAFLAAYLNPANSRAAFGIAGCGFALAFVVWKVMESVGDKFAEKKLRELERAAEVSQPPA